MKASDMIAILSRFNKKEDELMTQIDITMRFGHYGNFHKK